MPRRTLLGNRQAALLRATIGAKRAEEQKAKHAEEIEKADFLYDAEKDNFIPITEELRARSLALTEGVEIDISSPLPKEEE